MPSTTTKLTTAVEHYFTDLQRVRASGSATGERSSYGPLANLLNAAGGALKPKVFCVGEFADQGAGYEHRVLYGVRRILDFYHARHHLSAAAEPPLEKTSAPSDR